MSSSTRSSSPSSTSAAYDERYVVPLEASRRGAHRARVSPIVAALPVVAVVGMVVGAIALVYVFLGNLNGGGSTSASSAEVSQSAAPTSASPAASASASPTGDAASPSPAAAADVDKTAVTLSVYNGSSTPGLGRKVADKLTGDGWTVGTTANWPGGTLAETTVYYGVDNQRDSALAIVKLIGKGSAKMSAAKSGNGIAVVVGRDYAAGAGTAAASTTKTKVASTKSSSPAATKASATPSKTKATATPTPTGN